MHRMEDLLLEKKPNIHGLATSSITPNGHDAPGTTAVGLGVRRGHAGCYVFKPWPSVIWSMADFFVIGHQ
ncbi:hypothetical protein ACOMHN_002815 [Nucella lapillus]